MIDDAYGATVAKRRLSRRLVALRVRAELSANEAGDQLNWSRGRLQRFEANQWRLPEGSFVRDLARIYGASDEEQSDLEELVRLARQRPWWREYDDVFENEFPGYENDATQISVYMPLVLPGLLQTRPYIEALLSVGPLQPDWRHRALAARLRRQQILDRPHRPPGMIAVITEASLGYRWGRRSDRQEQVQHLVETSQRPNIELRLLRFADGPHPGMSSLIDIFDFPDDEEPSVVYLENDTAVEEVTRSDDVRAYKETFAQIRKAALAPDETRAHLVRIARRL